MTPGTYYVHSSRLSKTYNLPYAYHFENGNLNNAYGGLRLTVVGYTTDGPSLVQKAESWLFINAIRTYDFDNNIWNEWFIEARSDYTRIIEINDILPNAFNSGFIRLNRNGSLVTYSFYDLKLKNDMPDGTYYDTNISTICNGDRLYYPRIAGVQYKPGVSGSCVLMLTNSFSENMRVEINFDSNGLVRFINNSQKTFKAGNYYRGIYTW